jgi:hypothetical protein
MSKARILLAKTDENDESGRLPVRNSRHCSTTSTPMAKSEIGGGGYTNSSSDRYNPSRAAHRRTASRGSRLKASPSFIGAARRTRIGARKTPEGLNPLGPNRPCTQGHNRKRPLPIRQEVQYRHKQRIMSLNLWDQPPPRSPPPIQSSKKPRSQYKRFFKELAEREQIVDRETYEAHEAPTSEFNDIEEEIHLLGHCRNEKQDALEEVQQSVQSRGGCPSIFPALDAGPAPAMGNGRMSLPPRREKIYCDNWIHEGVCAFTQMGCKYKHVMPTDKATQMSLGVNHGFPSWYCRAYHSHSNPQPTAAMDLVSARDFEEAIVDEASGGASPIQSRDGPRDRSRRGTVTTLDPRSVSPPNSRLWRSTGTNASSH